MSAVMENLTPVVAPKVSKMVLVEARLGLAEHKRQDWVVDADEGTTLERVMEEDYWSYVAVKLNQYDRIEVREESGKWIADLIVTASGRNWAKTHLAAHHELNVNMDAPAASVKHRAEWKGPHKKFAVIRLSDRTTIQDGFQTKPQADEWLANHERVTT